MDDLHASVEIMVAKRYNQIQVSQFIYLFVETLTLSYVAIKWSKFATAPTIYEFDFLIRILEAT